MLKLSARQQARAVAFRAMAKINDDYAGSIDHHTGLESKFKICNAAGCIDDSNAFITRIAGSPIVKTPQWIRTVRP